MQILSRDFAENQIIVASIYEYEFKQIKRIDIKDRLIDQQVEEFV